MKRFALLITMVALIKQRHYRGICGITGIRGYNSKRFTFYIKPDISVELDGIRQTFKDINGQTVYPIIYNGRHTFRCVRYPHL